jgi:cytidylate kinase
MEASVICVSHADGAEGRAVGRLVAETLGYRFADDAIVSSAAREAGLFSESVSYAERKEAKRSVEVDFGRVEKTETLRDLIRSAITRAADEGKVVIVAHAASYALTDRDDVLRVLVTAPDETRVARIAEEEEVDAKRAAKRLGDSDKGRAVYLERFYGIKTEQPTDYDLVVNTDRLTTDEAAALVVAAAGPKPRTPAAEPAP